MFCITNVFDRIIVFICHSVELPWKCVNVNVCVCVYACACTCACVCVIEISF